MVIDIVMPDLSTLDYIMEKGTVVRWLKKEGEAIQKGEPILEIMSAKVTMEIEAQTSGILTRILVTEGLEVPPGTVLGIIKQSSLH